MVRIFLALEFLSVFTLDKNELRQNFRCCACVIFLLAAVIEARKPVGQEIMTNGILCNRHVTASDGASGGGVMVSTKTSVGSN